MGCAELKSLPRKQKAFFIRYVPDAIQRIGWLVGHRQKFFYFACAQYRGLDFLGVNHRKGRCAYDLVDIGAPRQTEPACSFP